ncbi:hypothetical protein quinque_002164 [Culex quinquefasciatus]
MEATDSGPEPQFPAEIWEHIFRFIPGSQLLQLRMICQRWSDIIMSSPSLMSRFYVQFKQPKGVLPMEDGYVPENLPPKAIKVLFHKCAIAGLGAVKSWWPAFAMKLTELQIGLGQISAENLLWMLQQAPNLKKLIMFQVLLSGSGTGFGDTNVRFNRLEMFAVFHLRYEDKNYQDILVGLEHKFPSLKVLRLDVAIHKNEAEILQSVRTLQSSLQRLHLPRGKNVLAKLCKMNQLRLKELQLDLRFPQDLEQWTKFCKVQQQQLEQLTLTANQSEFLVETGRVLRNLKRLSLTLHGDMEVSFLDAMPGLEVLEITADSKIDFLAHKSPNLTQFRLNDVETEDLFQYLQRSQKLAQIYLSGCRLGNREISVTRHFRSLKVLSLEDITCDADLLVSLFGHSPLLEDLYLSWIKSLEDEHVLVACKRLRRLKKLSLVSIRGVTDESAQYIQRYCPVLEELEADFSDQVLDQLEADKKIRIKRCDSDWSGFDSGEDDLEDFDAEDDYDEDEGADDDYDEDEGADDVDED